MKVYVLEDCSSSRSTGPELVGIYASIVPALNASFALSPQYREDRKFHWNDNVLIISNGTTITETEVIQ